jgi:hypothetical protein
MLDPGMCMLKLWWYGYRGDVSVNNYGDALTPAMFQAWNIPFEYSTDFDTISIGSIAKVAGPGTRVLSSGIMSRKDGCNPAAEWLWVRGPHTRAKVIECGGTCPEVYGDMAMLLPLFVDESAKRYDVGIIPHIRQLTLARELYPQHRIIDLRTEDAFRTAREITECRTILSSSLHGIITAHAYGIPAAHIDLGIHIKGDGVKFEDHYDAVGSLHVLSTVEEPVFSTGRLDLQPLLEILDSLKS